jgi:thiamine pyrophosphokinase
VARSSRTSTPRHVVVLAGGVPAATPLPRPLAAADLVLAADGGLALAAPLGLDVDLVVGDLDSVSATDLATARARGAEVEEHPTDKDRTDLAIALDAAVLRGASEITVVGNAGGRLDHLLGGLLLLAAEAYATCRITALVGPAVVTVCHDEVALEGAVGELVSLLPAHGRARGVRTDGLRFPLHDEDLLAGSSRGVSNELAAATARVRVQAGALLVVQPGGSPAP